MEVIQMKFVPALNPYTALIIKGSVNQISYEKFHFIAALQIILFN